MNHQYNPVLFSSDTKMHDLYEYEFMIIGAFMWLDYIIDKANLGYHSVGCPIYQPYSSVEKSTIFEGGGHWATLPPPLVFFLVELEKS